MRSKVEVLDLLNIQGNEHVILDEITQAVRNIEHPPVGDNNNELFAAIKAGDEKFDLVIEDNINYKYTSTHGTSDYELSHRMIRAQHNPNVFYLIPKALKLCGKGAFGHVYDINHMLIRNASGCYTPREISYVLKYQRIHTTEPKKSSVIIEDFFLKKAYPGDVIDSSIDVCLQTSYTFMPNYGKPLSPKAFNSYSSIEKLDIVIDLFEQLKRLHELDIVHRDLKPENILIDANLRVHIIDFGLSRQAHIADLNSKQSALGTASYVSAEQGTPETKACRHSDIFSACVSIAYLLTGITFNPHYKQVKKFEFWNRNDVDYSHYPSAEIKALGKVEYELLKLMFSPEVITLKAKDRLSCEEIIERLQNIQLHFSREISPEKSKFIFDKIYQSKQSHAKDYLRAALVEYSGFAAKYPAANRFFSSTHHHHAKLIRQFIADHDSGDSIDLQELSALLAKHKIVLNPDGTLADLINTFSAIEPQEPVAESAAKQLKALLPQN